MQISGQSENFFLAFIISELLLSAKGKKQNQHTE